jgi:hypothetical protein
MHINVARGVALDRSVVSVMGTFHQQAPVQIWVLIPKATAPRDKSLDFWTFATIF